MYTNFGQAVSEIQNKFEGGVSFNVDWYNLGGQAARMMNKKINSRSNKRRVPIYGGVSADLPLYTCPDDVSVPAALYPNSQIFSGRAPLKYRAPSFFYKQPETDRFTIDYINGLPFIVANISQGQSQKLFDVSDVTQFSGVALTPSRRNFIYSSMGASGTFDDTNFSIGFTPDVALDLSLFKDGVIAFPLLCEDKSKIDYVAVQLLTSGGNYYEVKTTASMLESWYQNNWNIARIDLLNKTTTGAPNIANITAIKAEVKMLTGESQTVFLDSLTIFDSVGASFEYYSTKIFQDAEGNFLAKPTVDEDLVVLMDEEYDIWFYEFCMLLVQDATYDSLDSKESNRFAMSLKDAYDLYNQRFPSMEEPITYSVSAEIDLDPYNQAGL
jgi:hypothetical protein